MAPGVDGAATGDTAIGGEATTGAGRGGGGTGGGDDSFGFSSCKMGESGGDSQADTNSPTAASHGATTKQDREKNETIICFRQASFKGNVAERPKA